VSLQVVRTNYVPLPARVVGLVLVLPSLRLSIFGHRVHVLNGLPKMGREDVTGGLEHCFNYYSLFHSYNTLMYIACRD
jgi:hypothetical protein